MTDTIAAIATPSGKGGVGIVRISGPSSLSIVKKIVQKPLNPRVAHFCAFKNQENEIIDQGIALYFKAPHSFTGEDVIELQAHGGPFILDTLLKTCLSHGCRIAKPGEFSERAFINDKIDLAQAEAIADLIDSTSERASRLAVRSLTGEFSHAIDNLVALVIELRMYVEAAIDFPDEEIDFLSDGKVEYKLTTLINNLTTLLSKAKQGAILREGFSIVLAGLPNAGKSTLLNRLAGKDIAIVTDVPGTTRDVMRQHIQLDGIPMHIIDTAGLRESSDVVEQEGIKRAWHEINQADGILLLIDANNVDELTHIRKQLLDKVSPKIPLTVVINKIDLNHSIPNTQEDSLHISAKEGTGLDALKNHLKHIAGFEQELSESSFLARRRHIDALHKAMNALKQGYEQLSTHRAGDLLAEDLKASQQHLSEITGEFTSDDLLGEIFSSFCIGK